MTQTPREIITERREQVKNLYFVRMYTQKQVADTLNWDEKTIWNDIQAIRTELAEKAKDGATDIFKGIIARKVWAIQQGINNYNDSKDVKMAEKWLALVQRLDRDLADFLLDIGIIRRVPAELDIEVRSVTMIANLIKEIKEPVLVEKKEVVNEQAVVAHVDSKTDPGKAP